MELYIGGRAQGKLRYVLQVRKIPKTQIWDDFEIWFKAELKQQKNAEKDTWDFLQKHPDTAVICDEVGNGIVPVDAFERDYRERLGRLLCEIAEKAERVERIICGIGQRIK